MHNALAGLTQHLIELLSQYGYPALFVLLLFGIVGLPVPDETLLTFCGYLIYRGRLNFGGTLMAGLVGSASGISISYFLGLQYGNSVANRFGRYFFLTPARILKTEQLFQRYGPILLAIGYFIPGVRHFTAVVAGMSGLRFDKFALFAYSGAALWVTAFLTLGYVFGDRWEHTSELVHHYTLVAAGILVGSLLLLWIIRTMIAAK